MSEFPKYPKTPRFNMGCLVTEKIDGTNGVISIQPLRRDADGQDVGYEVRAGSRKRWLDPDNGKDNFGFGAWVRDNGQALIEILGVGTHYGEWWGKGIQRGYVQNCKTFSLFDGTGRYPSLVDGEGNTVPVQLGENRLSLVPLLYVGPLDTVLRHLGDDEAVRDAFLPNGSLAQQGYMQTEGVIVQLRGSGGGQRFKIVWNKG